MSFTIPARLARPAIRSRSPIEARQRAIQLYRDWCHGAPEMISLYALNVSPAYIRYCIRQRFERHRHVTDPRAIEVLLLKSRQEYQETMNCWKLPDQVLGVLLKPQERTKKTFLQKFYEGGDEEALIPAASGVV